MRIRLVGVKLFHLDKETDERTDSRTDGHDSNSLF